MVNKEIIGIIFLIVLGLIILIFKPVRLLAGLTFITKEEKEKINTEKICKYAAIFLFCYAGYFTFFYFVEIRGGFSNKKKFPTRKWTIFDKQSWYNIPWCKKKK